ncbi:uncharacterized protein LOC109546821 [Dendroctonus ponderosae]
MAQGKLKVKSKLPSNNKTKKPKGTANTKRANAPSVPKKQRTQQAHKLKQIITKTVNKTAEDEIRSRAGRSNLNLTQAQQAVAKHNMKRNSEGTGS